MNFHSRRAWLGAVALAAGIAGNARLGG